MATHLPYLPEELLSRIVSEFEPSDFLGHGNTISVNYDMQRETLMALSLVNKQFHRLAQPLLYRSIYPTSYGSSWTLRLMRTLLEKPKLAGLIRNVRMGSVISESNVDPNDVEEALGGGLPELFNAATQRLRETFNHNDFPGRLLRSLELGNGAACMTLLLFIAKGITFLELTIPYEWRETFMYEVVQALATEPAVSKSVLPNLNSIQVAHWDTENASGFSRLSNFLRLSSLESLRGNMLEIEPLDMDTLDSEPCHLRKIELTYSIVDAPGLERLLGICPKLEDLSIHWGDAVVGDCGISWPDFGDALRRHGASLRALMLDPSEAFFYEDWNPPYAPLGDLRSLIRLEKLEVPCMCLIGVKDEEDEEGGEGEEEEDGNFVVLDLTSMLPTSLGQLEIRRWAGGHQDEQDCAELSRRLSGLMVSPIYGALGTVSFGRGQPILEDFEDAAWRRVSAARGRMCFKRISTE